MSSESPICPNCSRPMRMVHALRPVMGKPDANVFECGFCNVSFFTEDHLPIAGLRVQ